MRAIAAFALLLSIPAIGSAQTTPRSTLIPPNAIDRANAATDQRRADAARAAEADRLAAANAARTSSASRIGPVAGSTMTDGVAGLGTRTDLSAPPAATPQF